MVTKDIICITCPQGCIIKVCGDPEKGEIVSCEGFKCKRGKAYAENEFVHPLRILTSSVKTAGAAVPLVAVRTAAPIPKENIFDVMAKIRATTVEAPIKSGTVILSDVFGTEVIATKTIL